MNFKNSQKGIGGMALVVILAVVVIAGGAIFYLSNDNSGTTEDDAMMQDEAMEGDDAMMEDDSMMEEDAMEGDDAMMENSVTVELTGQNFEFSQDTITVKRGQEVTINFESTQGFHDWVIDEFDAATEQVNPGEPTSVTFVADQAGEFEFYCSVGNHRQQGMVGTLIVEE